MCNVFRIYVTLRAVACSELLRVRIFDRARRARWGTAGANL
jgi:hypothetical protein